jgi:hypothetical protein
VQAYQRKRHRIVWVIISLVVMAALFIALVDHAHIPRVEQLPVATQAEGSDP